MGLPDTKNSNSKETNSENKIKDRRASSVSLNETSEKSAQKRSQRSHSFHGGRSNEQKKKDKMAAAASNLSRRESERNLKEWRK